MESELPFTSNTCIYIFFRYHQHRDVYNIVTISILHSQHYRNSFKNQNIVEIVDITTSAKLNWYRVYIAMSTMLNKYRVYIVYIDDISPTFTLYIVDIVNIAMQKTLNQFYTFSTNIAKWMMLSVCKWDSWYTLWTKKNI